MFFLVGEGVLLTIRAKRGVDEADSTTPTVPLEPKHHWQKYNIQNRRGTEFNMLRNLQMILRQRSIKIHPFIDRIVGE
jgi:hypothetical protein